MEISGRVLVESCAWRALGIEMPGEPIGSGWQRTHAKGALKDARLVEERHCMLRNRLRARPAVLAVIVITGCSSMIGCGGDKSHGIGEEELYRYEYHICPSWSDSSGVIIEDKGIVAVEEGIALIDLREKGVRAFDMDTGADALLVQYGEMPYCARSGTILYVLAGSIYRYRHGIQDAIVTAENATLWWPQISRNEEWMCWQVHPYGQDSTYVMIASNDLGIQRKCNGIMACWGGSVGEDVCAILSNSNVGQVICEHDPMTADIDTLCRLERGRGRVTAMGYSASYDSLVIGLRDDSNTYSGIWIWSRESNSLIRVCNDVPERGISWGRQGILYATWTREEDAIMCLIWMLTSEGWQRTPITRPDQFRAAIEEQLTCPRSFCTSQS